MPMTTATSILISLLPFAISMSFTPGPNNLMVANSGARFGFVRTIPHQAGVVIGFSVMTLLVGLGVAGVVTAVPALYTAMKFASIAYLVYLAWRIATAESLKTGAVSAKPLTFLQGAAFQWVNPKGWIMALGAVTTYTTLKLDLRLQVVLIAGVFAVVGVFSTSTWTIFGQMIRRYLTTRRRRTVFNCTMAGLLLLSVIPVLIERA